jgi:succinoglycan biosynthesis transport protein ExoP
VSDPTSNEQNPTEETRLQLSPRVVQERPALAAMEADEAGADIGQYIAIVRQRIWLIMFCTLIALLIGVVVLKYADPEYTAKSSLKYEPRESRIVSFENVEAKARSLNEIDTQIELIRSQRVARAVIDTLGIYDVPESTEPAPEPSILTVALRRMSKLIAAAQARLVSFGPPVVDPDVVREQAEVSMLLEDVVVTRRLETAIIEISVTRKNPTEAARIADQFAEQFILGLAADQSEAYRYARELLVDQVQGTKARLQQAERKLYEYAAHIDDSSTTNSAEYTRSDIRVLEQNRDIAINTMRDLNNEIENVKTEISNFEAETTAAAREDIRTVLVAKDPQFAKILDRLRELQIESITLAAENTPDYPALQKGEREIETINSQLTAAAETVMMESRGRLELAKARYEGLTRRLMEQERIVLDIQAQMIAFSVLQREVDSEQELYRALLDRSKQLSVTEKIAPSAVTIVANATIPMIPTAPRVWRTLFIAGMLGAFFGIAFALLVATMDRSVKDPEMVESQLGLPSLGFVPFLSKGKGILGIGGSSHSLITNYDMKAPEAEAFRYIRTSLQYASAGRPPQVLLVTSCVPQEGKSTTAANLALSFSEKGAKTLLIDCDLKAPTVHKIFSVARSTGLSDVLTGQVELAKAIRPRVGAENLDVLTAGPPTPSPVDLLDSPQMGAVLAELRKTYATIVIDCAPCHGMADALVLSRRSDGVCLVVNPGRTINDVLHKTVASLDRVGAHLFGVIYNSKSRSIGGAAAYGYGYGDGYGRADDAKDAKAAGKT